MLFKTQCDKTDRAQLIWLNFSLPNWFYLELSARAKNNWQLKRQKFLLFSFCFVRQLSLLVPIDDVPTGLNLAQSFLFFFFFSFFSFFNRFEYLFLLETTQCGRKPVQHAYVLPRFTKIPVIFSPKAYSVSVNIEFTIRGLIGY